MTFNCRNGILVCLLFAALCFAAVISVEAADFSEAKTIMSAQEDDCPFLSCSDCNTRMVCTRFFFWTTRWYTKCPPFSPYCDSITAGCVSYRPDTCPLTTTTGTTRGTTRAPRASTTRGKWAGA